MRRFSMYLVMSGLATLACGGGGAPDCPAGTVEKDGTCASQTPAESDTDTATDSDTDGDVSSHAPQILSFTTDVLQITEGESVTFILVATDPDGIDDLIGGTLEGAGGETYASFSTSATEGTYSVTLSWSDMNRVDSVDFTGSEGRAFIARMYDSGGEDVTDSVTVDLVCDEGACAGSCKLLSSDASNCGACGSVCDVACDASQCIEATECLASTDYEGLTIEEVCADLGGECRESYADWDIFTEGTCGSPGFTEGTQCSQPVHRYDTRPYFVTYCAFP